MNEMKWLIIKGGNEPSISFLSSVHMILEVFKLNSNL